MVACTLPALAFEPVDQSPPGAHFDKVLNFDILSIMPGDTPNDVKTKLKAAFPNDSKFPESRLQGNVSNPAGAQVAIDYINEIARPGYDRQWKLYHPEDPADWPVVVFASQVYDNRAIGIRRAINFAPDKFMSSDALRVEVEKKYGKPTLIGTNVLDGSSENLTYLYAKGQLIAPLDAATQNCLQGGTRVSDECRFFIQANGNDPVTGQFKETITATQACGSALSLHDFLTFDFNRKVEIEDPDCDGVLKVSFSGSAAQVRTVYFELVDIRRSIGHDKAFRKAIDDGLKGGSTRSDVEPPKL